MKKFSFILLVSISILFLFNACEEKEPPIKIAISKAWPVKNYSAYYKWIKAGDSTIVCEDMYHLAFDSALKLMEDCSALLLTGGADVYPSTYGKEEDTMRCGSFDFHRDSLEFALIEKAMEMQIPILGICRGEQILNVSQGGSLYIDIPTDYGTDIMHRSSGYLARHDVIVEPGTKLAWATNVLGGNVNSAHHQGIKKLAEPFRITARATDGFVEAIEWKDPMDKPFFMAVQWHPEQLSLNNPLSSGILEAFIDAVKTSEEDIK